MRLILVNYSKRIDKALNVFIKARDTLISIRDEVDSKYESNEIMIKKLDEENVGLNNLILSIDGRVKAINSII